MNGFTQTIPAGSFVRKVEDDDEDGEMEGKFVFKAPKGASGIKKVEIRDDFRFEVKVNRIEIARLGGFPNPADFSIRIGNDFGQTSALFKIKSEKDHDDDKDKKKDKKKGKKKDD